LVAAAGGRLYALRIEAAWKSTKKLQQAIELVVQEMWQHSLLPQLKKEDKDDGSPSLSTSTIHWKLPQKCILLLE
jgi:hypothetical protein